MKINFEISLLDFDSTVCVPITRNSKIKLKNNQSIDQRPTATLPNTN